MAGDASPDSRESRSNKPIIVEGRIVDAGWTLDRSHPRTIVMSLLEWKQGTFKLAPSANKRRDVDLALPITHLLLESARLADEASRRLPS